MIYLGIFVLMCGVSLLVGSILGSDLDLDVRVLGIFFGSLIVIGGYYFVEDERYSTVKISCTEELVLEETVISRGDTVRTYKVVIKK